MKGRVVYERIVVPLDGSELAERALPHAAEMARLTGSPIHLVRVIDIVHLVGYGSFDLAIEHAAYDQTLAAEDRAAREYLTAIEHDLVDRGLRVTWEIRRGPVRKEITATVRPGDLVVMASHGRGGIPRWFLGSVAEEVVRHATGPVLLIRVAATAVPEAERIEAAVGATHET
jgi:nucleotide-binding universal stress UspA family protein